ncbi:MAG TPA: tail fiber protein [Chthoniobacter sp.]|jgi:microcystin-dependent protein
MSAPYIGEIRMFAGNFAPVGWAFCNGALVPISENDALFNLLGTTYGGDGQNTFGLPDLRSRVPIHWGASFVPGANGGVESVTLGTPTIPAHTHTFIASQNAGNQNSPVGFLPAANNSVKLYTSAAPNNNMSPKSIGNNGGSQPHSNLQPYLCINFILSLYGIYPTQQ